MTWHGNNTSAFHDIFTDHQVVMQRFRCSSCQHEKPSTVRSTFSGIESAELMKVQAELGSKHTFRKTEHIFSLFTSEKRQINNHDRIKKTAEKVGNILDMIGTEEIEIVAPKPAAELI